MSNSVKKSALIITFMTLMYKIIGFFKEILLAYYYGTGSVIDAYIMALTIPTILFGWLSSLSVSYVPFYYELEKEDAIREYTNSIITITIIFAIVCIVLGQLFAPWLVKICAPGYSGERYELTLEFYRIYLYSCLFLPLYKIFVSLVKCRKAFVLATIPDLFNSFIVIIVIFISQYVGKKFLAYGNLFASIIQVFLIVGIAIKLGYKYKPEIKINSYIKNTVVTAVPIFFSNMLIQINLFIDRIFASKLNTGSLSALSFGETIKDFVYYLGSFAVLTMIFPLIAEKVSENKMKEAAKIVKKGFNLTIVLFIPLQFGIMFFSRPLIELVFQRGMFSANSSDMTSKALIFYSLGLFAIILNAISHNLYYSLRKTKWVLFTSIGNVIFNIIFNVLLVKKFDYIGLACSTSISSLAMLPINLYLVKKVFSGFLFKETGITLLKATIASVIMIAIIFPTYNIGILLVNGAIFSFIILLAVIIFGIIIYGLLLILMKVPEVEFYLELLLGIVGKVPFAKKKI